MGLGAWWSKWHPRPAVAWVRTRPKRQVGGLLATASLMLVAAGWALRDPWPAIEVVAIAKDEVPEEFDRGHFGGSPGVLVGRWAEATPWDRAESVPKQAPEVLPDHPARVCSADGASCLEASGSEVVRVDAQSGATLGRISVAPREVASLGFGLGDRTARVVVHDQAWVGHVVVWDLATGALTDEPIHAAREFRPIGHSNDGRFGAYEGPLGSIQVWDFLQNRPITKPLQASVVEPIGWGGAIFAPDDQTLVVGRGLAKVEVWDLTTGQLRRVLSDHPSGLPTARLVVSPDERTLAWAALGPAPETHFAAVWDALARQFPGWRWFQNRAVTRRSVALFDLPTGRFLGQAEGADYPRFSPDGRFLATWQAEEEGFAIRPVPLLPPVR